MEAGKLRAEPITQTVAVRLPGRVSRSRTQCPLLPLAIADAPIVRPYRDNAEHQSPIR
jgi:hypothetical protein